LVIAIKAAIGLAVLLGGFRAVSDDDFARVVLSQQWAHAPVLDPTGSSWLPVPFWMTGGAMQLFGTSLTVARVVAFVLGIGAAGLVYAAARMLSANRRAALAGAVLASIFPWSARLGVATVPELFTAALTVFALATLVATQPRYRLLGGAALLVACLSRYEPWPVAAMFCLFTLLALRPSARRYPPSSKKMLLGACVLAAAGPILWLLHNALAHADALHFATRVSDYKRALGGSTSLGEVLAGYPLALLREEPELCLVAAVLALSELRRLLSASRDRWAIAASLLVMLVALTVAALPGGAPTHHSGRALLAIWLMLCLYLGSAMQRVFAEGGWRPRVLVGLVLAALLVGGLILRPWYARLDAFTARGSETSIGAAAGKHMGHRDAALLQVVDYRYLAVRAGSGQPWQLHPDRSIDPRRPKTPSSFANAERLGARLRLTGERWVIAHDSAATQWLGPPVAVSGRWRLWKVRN